MASPETIDLAALLAPISEEAPTGIELKSDPELMDYFYDVKDARDTARTRERKLLQEKWTPFDNEKQNRLAGLESPDWRPVVTKAIEALGKSKDLWIATWLTEGLVREHGVAGLRDGFKLINGLCEQYWDSLFPHPDEEDGVATTVAQLAGLNSSLNDPLNLVPLTNSRDHGELDGFEYLMTTSLETKSDPDEREPYLKNGAKSMSEFQAAIDDTPADFYKDLAEDTAECEAEVIRYDKLMDEKCGVDDDGYAQSPPTSQLKGAIEDFRLRFSGIAPGLAESTELVESESGEMVVQGSNGATIDGRVANREDAFRALNQVADYFSKTEPHSPVSYALRQVVRWGRMSLPELLTELISDSNAREDMFRRTGIESPSEDE